LSLLDNFSQRVMLPAKSPCRFPATAGPQTKFLLADMDRPFGEKRRGQITGLKRRSAS
jgi:hypothetical protein